MPSRVETTVHRLINLERKRRGLPRVRWSGDMYKLAKSHSKRMARAGRLFHSNRPALKGGENCWEGKGYSERALPKAIVNSWMKSRAGHREWLLHHSVKTAAVGISKSKRGTFAAWAFSDQPLLKPFKIRLRGFKIPLLRGRRTKRRRGVLRLPVKLILILASIFAIVLGAHGLYVYFSRLELLLGGEASKLFLTLGVPAWLRAPIEWMSWKGFQSWFIPAVFIFLGLVMWYWQSKIDEGNVSRWLRKLHLW